MKRGSRRAWSGALLAFLALLCMAAAYGILTKTPREERFSADQASPRGTPLADSLPPFRSPGKFAGIFADYRKKWTRLTGYEYSGLHWGQIITIYVNRNPDTYVKNYLEYVRLYVNADIDESSLAEQGHFEPYAVGTVFLKENFRSDSGKRADPLTITAMIKQEKGYDPATHDWEFIQFDVNGNLLVDGNSRDAPAQAMCIKCHGNISERDFIFSTFCSLIPK